MGTLKVLIVDNSAIVRERIIAMLSEVPKAPTISQAKDSLEAIELLHKLNPELVIMDINIPGGSGIDTLREIKKGNRPPLVIVLTSQSYPQYRKKCLKAGADFFFDKSTEFDKVAKVLNQLS